MSKNPADDIILREARDEDFPALAAIHAAAFVEPWTEADRKSLNAGPGTVLMLAEMAGAAAGFVMVRQAADEAEILALVVAQAHRRKGIARVLLARASDWASLRGARQLFLEVGVGNDAARNLYMGLGFFPVGTRQDYYGQGADALILRAWLPLQL